MTKDSSFLELSSDVVQASSDIATVGICCSMTMPPYFLTHLLIYYFGNILDTMIMEFSQ